MVIFGWTIPLSILAGLAAALILMSCASNPSSSRPDSDPIAAGAQTVFALATSAGSAARGGDKPYRYAGSVTEERT